ncbi:MAG: IMP dehydrogenase [Bacillota bacterium]|nr:IMP dehydrogenase [Bacillota bacterium]
MAQVFEQESRTFSEYLLIPNLTTRDCVPENVQLRADLVRYRRGREASPLMLNIPMTSAIMQAVSDANLAIALTRSGGLSFIYGSQSIASQAAMVRQVKKFKAGIVVSDTNLTPAATLADVLEIRKRTGHATISVTHDGSSNGRLLGLVTSRDTRVSRMQLTDPVTTFMTPLEKLVTAPDGISLSEANDIIWAHKINQLPIITAEGNLVGLVFRKDYEQHKDNPLELLDASKRLLAAAGINTRDYRERVPALVEAGVDVLCIDSSDGFSEWQADTLDWVREHYPDMPIGAGNVVDEDGFRYLADHGASFIKVGIGGGSICITREQKGIGCGQATAVMNVARARDRYFEETGWYIPICSDGGIVFDYHMALALAMGADFLMLGRYFARFDESPGRRLVVNGAYVKEYWGEGSNRARNWQRYGHSANETGLVFEEGVDSYVPYAGSLRENLDSTLAKLKATMVSCGSTNLDHFREHARLVMVSATSIVEGGAHDVIAKESERLA